MDLSKYTKFFNYGYFLSQHEPAFLRKLLKATEGQDEINEPLSMGKSQYNKEQVLDKLKDLSKESRGSNDREKGMEPEI